MGGREKLPERRPPEDKAPPSLPVKTGKPYLWLPTLGPETLGAARPGAPWLLKLPAIVPPKVTEDLPVPSFAPPVKRLEGAPSGSLATGDLLLAIPHKVALARSWGLRIASRRTNAMGWLKCHALDRDDNNPSASFHAESGWYNEPHTRESISQFNPAVRLGAYPTWEAACNDLGDRYCGPARPRSSPRPRTIWD